MQLFIPQIKCFTVHLVDLVFWEVFCTQGIASQMRCLDVQNDNRAEKVIILYNQKQQKSHYSCYHFVTPPFRDNSQRNLQNESRILPLYQLKPIVVIVNESSESIGEESKGETYIYDPSAGKHTYIHLAQSSHWFPQSSLSGFAVSVRHWWISGWSYICSSRHQLMLHGFARGHSTMRLITYIHVMLPFE